MATEVVKTGKIYRILADETSKLWHKISFWSKASDTEFNDGKNAETKLGAINGITDSLNSTSSNVAASAKAVSSLNSNLTANGSQLYMDYHDGKYGINTSPNRGADTFIPFRSGMVLYDEIDYDSFTYTSPQKKPAYYSSYDFVAGGYHMEEDIVYVDVIFKTTTANAQITQQEFPPPVSEFTIYNTPWFNGSNTASSSNPYNILEHPNIPYNPDAGAGTTFTSFAKSEQKLTIEGKITLPGNQYGKTWHFQFVYRTSNPNFGKS